jgi:preprotein translocase subunit SecA
MGRQELSETLGARARQRYEERERQIGAELMQIHQRLLMLQIVDTQWKDHLYAIDHLKEGIGLRGYGQRDPLVEYKKESFALYQALMDRIDEEILRWIYMYQPVQMPAADQLPPDMPPPGAIPPDGPTGGTRPLAASDLSTRGGGRPGLERAAAGSGWGAPRAMARNLTFNDPGEAPSAFRNAERPEAHGGGTEVMTVRREGKKVGRNDPCPCGSGKKYKKCHGAN